MKKTLVILLILSLLTVGFMGTALAGPNTVKQGDKQEEKQELRDENKAEREAAKAEREAAKEAWKEEFNANKLSRTELKAATKAQIQEQKEITKMYKLQLQTLMQEIENLPEEEQALYADQINQLRTQIKEAQGYVLQIRFEGQEAKFMLSPSFVTPAQRPVPEEEVVEEVTEEILDDIA